MPYRLNVAAACVSEAMAQVYAAESLSIPAWRVMATLGESATATATEIARRTHMHKTKVSRAVAELSALDFVVRRPNERDAREAFLALSDQGRAAYGALVPVVQDFVARLTADVTAQDLAVMETMLTRLTRKAVELTRPDSCKQER